MVFTVRAGLLISSIIYRIRSDGRAIIIRITAGRMVQIVSTSWASIVLVCVNLVVNISEIIYSTKELIRNTIIKVWSWKFVSSSIMGEVASCSPSCSG